MQSLGVGTCTIGEALVQAHATSKECQHTLKRLAVDAHALFPLNVALTIVYDRLESVVDDEEVGSRLDEINVENRGYACKLLLGLLSDLQTIYGYLRSVGSGRSPDEVKNEVNVYAETLNQYSRVIKIAEKSSTKDALKRIDTEVVLLNEVLAKMHSSMARPKEPAQSELYSILDRLRPLRSAFHDSWGAPEPCRDDSNQDTISYIIRWLDELNQEPDRPSVLCLFGDDRSVTSAVAQSAATWAQSNHRLMSSFFFAWAGKDEERSFAHLVSTITYKIAQFDSDFLRSIAGVVAANPDIRDQAASTQILLLLKRPFMHMADSVLHGSQYLIVIDALDTCVGLEDSKVAEDIMCLIQTLARMPFRTRILITGRFSQALQHIVENSEFPSCQWRTLPRQKVINPAHIEPPGRLWNTHKSVQKTDFVSAFSSFGSELSTFLDHVSAAQWDSRESPTGCLKGTRVEVVRAILAWCNKPTDCFTIYWLAGHAGTGKSTIAKTLSQTLVSQAHAWVLTFFLSKNSADRTDPLRILHSLVWQLAQKDVYLCQQIMAIVRSQSDIKQRPLKEQAKQLLLAAIELSIGVRPIILVIDALDECSPTHGVDGGEFIRNLAEALADMPVRLVVTSRMEAYLCRILASLPSKVTQLLHEVEETSVEADVRLILMNGFKRIASKHEIRASPWPSQEDLEALVERTGRFIIFAITVLKFVESDRFSPEYRLREIIDNTSVTSASPEFGQVDALYLDVLRTAAQSSPTIMQVDNTLCRRLCTLVGTLVLLRRPLGTVALSQLLRADQQIIEADVQALSPILQVSPDESDTGPNVIRIFHPSFRDFLLERCDDWRFSIDVMQQQHSLSLYCLQIMNTCLKRDICDIKNPTVLRSEVSSPVLLERLQQHMFQSVQYACQFWISHIVNSGSPDANLFSALQTFTWQHTLHWVEALSLIAKIHDVIRDLPEIIGWMQCHTQMPVNRTNNFDLCQILDDLYRILLRCRHIMEAYPLQIYYTVAISLPQCSLLEVVQEHESIDVPRLLTNRDSHWPHSTLVFEGHIGGVLCVQFSPDGAQIVTGSEDETVRLWDARTGHETAKLEGHTSWVRSVAFSPDATQIVSGSYDETIRLWDARTGHEIAKLEGHTDCVWSVAFSPDSTQIVSGSEDKTVRLWDARTGHETAKLEGHTSLVMSVAFSPDGTQIVSGSSDKTARLWDARTGHETAKLEGHINRIMSVAFSPDGTQIVSSSYDKTARLWDARTGHEAAKLEGHTNWVMSVAFSPDGTQIVTGSEDETVRLWDARTGHETAKLEGHINRIMCVAFSPDGTQIMSSSYDKTVRLWDARTGHEAAKLEGHTDYVWSIAFSPDGTQIVTGSEDETVRLWDARTGHETAKLEGHINRIMSVAFSPDGTQIVSSSYDMTVRLWDARTEYKTAKLEGHTDQVKSVAFSPDGTQILSSSYDETIRLWDAWTGHEIAKLEGGHTDEAVSVAFSPDGAQIVTGPSDKTVRLWDARTGHEIAKLEGHTDCVWSVAFSPDSTQIVSGSSDETVRLWDARTGHETAKLEGHTGRVNYVAFSPDGTQIMSSSYDKTVRLWDARTGHEAAKLEGHTDYVWSIAFSPDGTQIATGSEDETVRLWDARTGHETAKLEGHINRIMSVAFSPDGTQIVSGSEDYTIRLWDPQRGIELAGLRIPYMIKDVSFSQTSRSIVVQFLFGAPPQIWTSVDILKSMALYNQTRSSSSDEVNLRKEAPTMSLSDTLKTSSTEVVHKSRWVGAHGSPLEQQTLLGPSFDVSPPSWFFVPQDQAISLRSLSFNINTGWIVLEDLDLGSGLNEIQLCWLPMEMRGDCFDSHQSMFVIASRLSYQLTIIDFEPMLTLLRRLGVLL